MSVITWDPLDATRQQKTTPPRDKKSQGEKNLIQVGLLRQTR